MRVPVFPCMHWHCSVWPDQCVFNLCNVCAGHVYLIPVCNFFGKISLEISSFFLVCSLCVCMYMTCGEWNVEVMSISGLFSFWGAGSLNWTQSVLIPVSGASWESPVLPSSGLETQCSGLYDKCFLSAGPSPQPSSEFLNCFVFYLSFESSLYIWYTHFWGFFGGVVIVLFSQCSGSKPGLRA